MRRYKTIAVLLLLVIVTLSLSGLVMAQASTNFDLGCWGVISTAGGVQQSPNFRLAYAMGQATAGISESANLRLRIGYVQNWRTTQLPVATPGPIPTPGKSAIYLPIVQRYVWVARSCSR